MKDRDKWRDQVEIALDSRQIFLLFCGVAVVISLVFGLGVVVGKRLRPPVADQPRTDPLALLDQFAGDETAGDTPTLPPALAADSGVGRGDSGAPKAGPGERPNAPDRAQRPEGEASDPASGSYALQLSSFQDRLEAEQFCRKLREAGLEPRIVPAQIPGRGLWFRVRLGSYESWEQAVAAKEVFEREHNVVAYVARR